MEASLVALNIAAAFFTYLLGVKLKDNFVLSSVLVTLLFAVVIKVVAIYFFLNFNLLTTSVFGASFVGMTSAKPSGWKFLLPASIIYTALFIYMVPHLQGHGGALGFAAFVSVVFVRLIVGIRLKGVRF